MWYRIQFQKISPSLSRFVSLSWDEKQVNGKSRVSHMNVYFVAGKIDVNLTIDPDYFCFSSDQNVFLPVFSTPHKVFIN